MSVGDLQQPRDLVAEQRWTEAWGLYELILGQLRQAERDGDASGVIRWRRAREYAIRQFTDLRNDLQREVDA